MARGERGRIAPSRARVFQSAQAPENRCRRWRRMDLVEQARLPLWTTGAMYLTVGDRSAARTMIAVMPTLADHLQRPRRPAAGVP